MHVCSYEPASHVIILREHGTAAFVETIGIMTRAALYILITMWVKWMVLDTCWRKLMKTNYFFRARGCSSTHVGNTKAGVNVAILTQ